MIRDQLEEARRLTEEELERLHREPPARELALVKTKVQEAEHWLDEAERQLEPPADASD